MEALRGVADAKGRTVAQVVIAWGLARGGDIVPLVGAWQRSRLEEALGALDLELDADELARLEHAVPLDAAAGSRYDARAMAALDSECKPGVAA